MMRFAIGILVAAIASSGAGAQQPAGDRASFYIVSHALGGTDTVIAERVTRTPTALTGEFTSRASGARVAYRAELAPGGLVTRIETTVRRSTADTSGQHATYVLDGDTIVAQAGGTQATHIPAAAGTLVIVNPSVAFIEQMLIHAKALGSAAGSVSFPIFILGGPQVIPLTVSWVGGDSATVRYASVTMRLAVSPDGRLLGGSIPNQQVSIVRGPMADTLLAVRRDYSAPPDAPYTAEDVIVHAPSGLRFTGTLTLPRVRRGERVPGVVTITGSGSEDRDEQPVVGLNGYRPFREIADTLGRRGIAVLRLDDRGVNGSDPGPPTATSADFADDIRAGVAYLRARPEIDPARIALVGHSEGGIIAPMVASTDPRLRGIVLMAGTASPGRGILRSQQYYVIDTMQHLTGARRDTAIARAQRATDSLAERVPWMKQFLEYDPSALARRVHTPVLILQGLTDHQVPASEAEKLATAFRAGGNRDVTVRTFPATNHLFVADPTGSFDYAKLPSLRVRSEVLGAVADWLSAKLR